MKEVKKKSPARIYITFAVVLVICGLIGGTAGYAAISNQLSVQDLSQWANQMLSPPGPGGFLPAWSFLSLPLGFIFAADGCFPRPKKMMKCSPG